MIIKTHYKVGDTIYKLKGLPNDIQPTLLRFNKITSNSARNGSRLSSDMYNDILTNITSDIEVYPALDPKFPYIGYIGTTLNAQVRWGMETIPSVYISAFSGFIAYNQFNSSIETVSNSTKLAASLAVDNNNNIALLLDINLPPSIKNNIAKLFRVNNLYSTPKPIIIITDLNTTKPIISPNLLINSKQFSDSIKKNLSNCLQDSLNSTFTRVYINSLVNSNTNIVDITLYGLKNEEIPNNLLIKNK